MPSPEEMGEYKDKKEKNKKSGQMSDRLKNWLIAGPTIVALGVGLAPEGTFKFGDAETNKYGDKTEQAEKIPDQSKTKDGIEFVNPDNPEETTVQYANIEGGGDGPDFDDDQENEENPELNEQEMQNYVDGVYNDFSSKYEDRGIDHLLDDFKEDLDNLVKLNCQGGMFFQKYSMDQFKELVQQYVHGGFSNDPEMSAESVFDNAVEKRAS